MKRRTLWKLLVSIMAFTMAAAPAITVCAEDVTEPVEVDNENLDIEGSVIVEIQDSYESRCAVDVSNGGKVTVSEDVIATTTENNNVFAIHNDGGNVTVGGSVSLDTPDDANYVAGVYSENGGTTTVKENIEAVKSILNNGGNVIVKGNAEGTVATILDGSNSNIYIGGDISNLNSNANAAIMMLVGKEQKGYSSTITVEGTVRSDGMAINHQTGTYEQGDGIDAFDQLWPCITLFAIDEPEENEDRSWYMESEGYRHDDEVIRSAINYIIHTEGDMELSGDDLKSVSDFATFTDLKEDHRTTKIGEIFTASVAKNYGIEGSSSVEVTKVSDGVYSVKLIDSKGGILLKATALSPNQNQNPGDGTAEDSRNDSSQTAPVLFVIQDDSRNQQATSMISAAVGNVPAGALKVAVPYGQKTIAPAVEGAPSPSKAVSIKVSELTDVQYKETIIQNIASTPMGGMLRIETDKAACFDRAMLETFAKRASVDLEVIFPVNGQMVRVVVPAGCNINNLLDKYGYCGFERLASILGSEVVK